MYVYLYIHNEYTHILCQQKLNRDSSFDSTNIIDIKDVNIKLNYCVRLIQIVKVKHLIVIKILNEIENVLYTKATLKTTHLNFIA